MIVTSVVMTTKSTDMPKPPKPSEFASLTILSNIPSALKPSANTPAAMIRITTPLRLLPIAWKNTLTPSAIGSNLNLCLTASKSIAMTTERMMIAEMSSLIEAMQYCENTTTKIIGKNGSIA